MSRKKTKKTVNQNIELVNADRLAFLMSVTRQRVYQMVDEGVVVKVSAGKYAMKDSLDNYHDMLRSGRNGASKDNESGYTDPIKRLRYEKELMEFEEQQGRLVNKEMLISQLKDVAAEFRVAIMAIPDRTPPLLMGKKLEEMRMILRKECGQALRDFVDGLK